MWRAIVTRAKMLRGLFEEAARVIEQFRIDNRLEPEHKSMTRRGVEKFPAIRELVRMARDSIKPALRRAAA